MVREAAIGQWDLFVLLGEMRDVARGVGRDVGELQIKTKTGICKEREKRKDGKCSRNGKRREK